MAIPLRSFAMVGVRLMLLSSLVFAGMLELRFTRREAGVRLGKRVGEIGEGASVEGSPKAFKRRGRWEVLI